jgi:hypothetical protein
VDGSRGDDACGADEAVCVGVAGAAEDIERLIMHLHSVGVAGESFPLKA